MEMNKNIIIGIMAIVIVVFGVLLFLNFGPETKETTGEIIEEEESVSENGMLHIVTLPWKSFAYEENGVTKGIGVDIMDKALKNLNVDYDIALVPWSRALRMTEVGEADGILLATHKGDRESYMAFTPEQLAYGREDIAPEVYLVKLDYILFLKRENEGLLNFESIDQLALDGYTIGVNQDFSYTPKINVADWDKVVHFSEAESFEALQNNEMDFFLASKEVGLEILNEIGLSEEITYIDNPVDSSYVFLIFSKNSDYPYLDKLIENFDKELIQIYESGEYGEIYNSYVK